MGSETLQAPRAAGQQRRLRTLAIVPAYNEADSIGTVLEEIRAAEPELEIVVINDGSTDSTAQVASAGRVSVVNLPFNVGIGGAVQTGYQYALENGFELAIQVDGDGQHDPREIGQVLEPILDGRADLAVGTRFVKGGGYRGTRLRRVGIRIFAAIVSLLVGQRVSDTTSGFRAVNRRGIHVFAGQYPHDYPEVETVVTAVRGGLRIVEVPVEMRLRSAGRSSITNVGSVYYVLKVLLALFIGLLPQGKVVKR